MVKIDQKPESPLSPIKFFVSKERTERAVEELGDGAFARPFLLEHGRYSYWCVKCAFRGYLRESGEVY